MYNQAVNKVISRFVMCSVMRPPGLIIQQQTASLGGRMALTIHTHQIVITCVFSKHFGLSFVNVFYTVTPPAFRRPQSPSSPSPPQCDRMPTKHFFMLKRLKVRINKMLESPIAEELDRLQVSLFSTFLGFFSEQRGFEVWLSGRSEPSH